MSAKMKQKAQNINMLLAFLTLVGVVAVVALVGFFTLQERPEIIQGQADVPTFRVSSKIPGRIYSYRVEEGDIVHVGDTLALLQAPDVYAKMQQAQAAEAAAQAQSDKAEHGARTEQIQGAYEMWQKARAGLDIAQKSYDRVKRLYDQGVVPAQKHDEALAQYNAMQATERAAHAQYNMARKGAQEEDKEAAAALVARAQGAVAEVESYIDESVLIAQLDGEVTEIFPQVGELVGTGAPIMNIAKMSDMYVTFNMREDKLQNFSLGTVITAHIPALDNKKYQFKINYIKDLGSYATWKATKTTGQYDMKTFEVRAQPLKHIEDLRPGMSILLDSEK